MTAFMSLHYSMIGPEVLLSATDSDTQSWLHSSGNMSATGTLKEAASKELRLFP